MIGLVIHWCDPWKDIHSGMDTAGSEYRHLAESHGLELIVIECDWPFTPSPGVDTFQSLDDVIAARPSNTFLLADLAGNTTTAAAATFDYLVVGPPEGWRSQYPTMSRWTYPHGTPGGFHALMFSHLAVAKLVG